MDISAVVLSFNSARYLGSCCSALVDSFNTLKLKGEIFVVENGSTDGSVEILRDLELQYLQIVIGIYSPVNTGTTVSRNMALSRVSGKYVLVIDSDAVANPEAISTLIQELEAHPECGLAVPRLTYKDGRHQISVDQFPTLMHKLERLLSLRKMELEYVMPTQTIEVDYAISAFWLFRREAIEKVGDLDEKIFYSPEDVDYCLRLWLAGMTIRYVPNCSAVHDAQELSRSKKLNGFLFRHAGGLMYFFRKHGYLMSLSGLRKRIAHARTIKS